MPPKRQIWSISGIIFMVIIFILLLTMTPFSMLPISPINTHLDKTCSRPLELIGPTGLDILDRKEDDSRVVLLSDWHMPNKYPRETCRQNIIPYLVDLFQTYDGKENIDFFLEIDFDETIRTLQTYEYLKDPRVSYLYGDMKNVRSSLLQGENPLNENYLVNLWAYFNDCMKRSKNTCEFNGHPVRFHYADVRRGVLHSNTNTETQTVISEYHKSLTTINNRKNITNKQLSVIDNMLTKYQQKDVGFFFHMSKIDKQIAKLPNEFIEVFYYIMRTYMEEFSDKAVRLQNALLESKATNNLEAGINHIQNSFQILLSPLFDIYTISRMVRHNMKQVIIYAGASHIKRIRGILLNYLNYKVTTEGGKCGVQCVDLADTPHPWFK